MLEESVSRTYFFGLAAISATGWLLGTSLGAILGSVVPQVISNALSIALYAMFIAIIIPGMKKDKHVVKVVFTSYYYSFMFLLLTSHQSIIKWFCNDNFSTFKCIDRSCNL